MPHLPPDRLYAKLLGYESAAPTTGEDAADIIADVNGAMAGSPARLEERLGRVGARDPAAAARVIASLAEDPLSRERFLALVVALQPMLGGCADPDMALRNLDRFARTSLDRGSLYRHLVGTPSLLRFLVDLFCFSQFLSDILIRNPEYLEWLLEPERLEREMDAAAYRASLDQATAAFRKIETVRRAACRWKRRHLLRIGARDMLGKADVPVLGRELTGLAEAVIQLAVRHATDECRARYGDPLEETASGEAARPASFGVYGMGKLGGQDLNFSSDIDLIFVYSDEGRTTGRPDPVAGRVQQITNHEYFTRLGERVIAFLSEPSDEGVLFRVDMRLRPEGKTGPLARSVASCSAYFVEQARAWERVAYLKARRVAGDEAIAPLFDPAVAFFAFTRQKPVDLAQEMHSLKLRIDREVLEGTERERDVKRGVGGIREIEFIAAFHQLTEGGRRPELRVRPTLEALERLAAAGIFDEADAADLAAAYVFLRRLEHRLQMMEERQTYLLPEDDASMAALARRAGYHDREPARAAAQLREDCRRHTSRVRGFFSKTFAVGKGPTPPPMGPAELLLSEATDRDPAAARAMLERAGFREPDTTLAVLREMALGSSEIAISWRGQRWFERILPTILDIGRRLPMPDAAVRQLGNFLRASKGISITYQLLAEHPAVLRMLLIAFASGPVPARQFIAHPEWFDEFVGSGLVAPGHEIAALESTLQRDLFTARDDETALRRLRVWKEKNALLLMTLETLELEPPDRLGRLTTDLADRCLQAVAAVVERRLILDMGAPHADGLDSNPPLEWTMLGLGGFGGRQVSHSSDLDVALIFSHEGRVPGDGGATASHWFSRLGEEIIKAMSAITPEGQLFKMDARLRPEGRNAPLAATLERYVDYYARAAQTWEWQAILKARSVAGDPALAERFLESLWALIPARFSEPTALAADIRAMRRRLLDAVKLPSWGERDLKRGRGGLVEIDFIIQYLQLKAAALVDADERPRILRPCADEALDALADIGAIAREDARTLKEEHTFLRRVQRRLRLFGETSRDYFPTVDERLDPLRRALEPGLPGGQSLVARLRESQARVAELYDRLVPG